MAFDDFELHIICRSTDSEVLNLCNLWLGVNVVTLEKLDLTQAAGAKISWGNCEQCSLS